MMTKWKKRITKIAVLILAVAVFLENKMPTAAKGSGLKHGTADVLITQDMLNESIPDDYSVNSATQGKGKNGDYNKYFLKDELQTVSIEIDENNLNYMFQNAADKPTVMARQVTIGDQSVSYVGLKTKGSYTLEHSVTDNPQSDRFSLTINFGKYIKKQEYGEKQNFYGVNKISFNNFFFDKSMMKEYCSLMLMSEMGVPTPQFGLAKLYINGRYYGVYSMIEALDSPILEQYYDIGSGNISDYLCKPEGTAFLYDSLAEDMSPLWEYDEDTYDKVKDMLPTVEEWVRKINLLSEGLDFSGNKLDVNSDEYIALLDEVIDTDEYLRYFAVHSFLCQLDNMFVGQKNFGLYVDETGRSLLIPWDYDLSFGCYSPVTAEATANNDLDTMYIPDWDTPNPKVAMKKFYKKYPLFNVIFQNRSLMDKYHGYMADCAKIMALGGTVSDGKFYEPHFASDRIMALTEPLTEAAKEPVTERAEYMNGIKQPRDLPSGLVNLQKITAMRSLGVYAQVSGYKTTVSGRGCDLSKVGNGQDNWWLQNQGNLSAINYAYGFFISANYSGDSPLLNVTEIDENDDRYDEIAKAVGHNKRGYYKCYFLNDFASQAVKGNYRLSIPVGKELIDVNPVFYHYADGKIKELQASLSDNIYTMETESLGIIIVTEKNSITAYAVIIVSLVLFLIVLAVFMMKRKKETSNEGPDGI